MTRGYGAAGHGTSGIMRGRADYFSPGNWNARCDQCGLKWKASDMRQQWNKLMCCPICWEQRNAQDFLKGMPDRPAPPWTRPDPPPIFVQGNGQMQTFTPAASYPMILNSYMLDSKMLG